MQDESYKEFPMKVSREVILDLLPLYIADEASPETRALVEEYLKLDLELRSRVDIDRTNSLTTARVSETALPPEVELRSLRRTRSLLRWQRHMYGWALALSIVSVGGVGFVQHGHPVFHFFFRDYPQVFLPCALLAVSCWVNYFTFRWRLRSTRL